MAGKRHSHDEIVAKLLQADAMVETGRHQAEIAHALGVSIMTYHRWSKARPDPVDGSTQPASLGLSPTPACANEVSRLDRLRAENARLRRLVADLLLEKVELEDALQLQRATSRRDKNPRP
jgi:transposase